VHSSSRGTELPSVGRRIGFWTGAQPSKGGAQVSARLTPVYLKRPAVSINMLRLDGSPRGPKGAFASLADKLRRDMLTPRHDWAKSSRR
jgi:hypothetical protein